MQRFLSLIGVAFALLGVAPGCDDDISSTELITEGPPMVVQVRMRENFTVAGDATVRTRTVFAYGNHPDATAEEVKTVTSGDATGNLFRIIMDELLVGNDLEEVVCRGMVDEDNLSRVPRGNNPEDMARCALPNDALVSSCPDGPKAVCICKRPEGCPRTGSDLVPEGMPVGIRDDDGDGAADRSALINGSVGIRCDGMDIGLNLDSSYYNPSGTQDNPALGGFDALGPAVVLSVPTMPTNTACSLFFAPTVVDKSGIGVCVGKYSDDQPDSVRDRAPECDPGDFSAFTFTVEALSFATAPPQLNGSTGVSRTNPVIIQANAPLDPDSIAGVTISPAVPGVTIFLDDDSMNLAIVIAPPVGGFAPNTLYTVTVPTSVRDSYGKAPPQTSTFTFTTAS